MRSLALLIPLAAFAASAPAAAQYGYPPPPGWGAPPESNLRINAKPKQASVYVDGLYAGIVDDFDGTYQRLHLPSGRHEVVLYMDGYRSLTRRLYLGPGATLTIKGTLEKLDPGETQDRPPEPPPAPASEQRPMPPRPPRGPAPYPDPTDQATRPRGSQAPGGEPSHYAALAIQVQPDSATIRIDGTRWEGPSGDERLIVQVPAGRHVVEVDHDGYESFRTEFDVRAGETAPVNVSLTRRR